jgi:hypothetical protein
MTGETRVIYKRKYTHTLSTQKAFGKLWNRTILKSFKTSPRDGTVSENFRTGTNP